MKFTIVGLKAIDSTKATELLVDFELGDIISGGLAPRLLEQHSDPEDPIATTEATALSYLIGAMLTADCQHGLTFYGKYILGQTDEDLRPDLENTDFKSDDAIYVVIDVKDPETYHSWVKKLGQWHLSSPGRSETLCGKPMLGNNYAGSIFAVNREKCEECFALVDEDVDKIHG